MIKIFETICYTRDFTKVKLSVKIVAIIATMLLLLLYMCGWAGCSVCVDRIMHEHEPVSLEKSCQKGANLFCLTNNVKVLTILQKNL